MQKSKLVAKNHNNKNQKKISDFFSNPKNGDDVKVQSFIVLSNDVIEIIDTPDKADDSNDFVQSSPLQENVLKSPIIKKRKHLTQRSIESKRPCKKVTHDDTKFLASSSANSSTLLNGNQTTPTKNKVTPNKSTPKKLVKTPVSAREFNNHIIQEFIKVTPVKCTNKENTDGKSTPRSNSLIQSSIDLFVSPMSSLSSLKAQNRNEKTPTKSSSDSEIGDRSDKVKVRLDFSFCSQESKESDNLLANITLNDTKLNVGTFDDSSRWSLDSFCWDEIPTNEYMLDLSQSQHCRIVKIEKYPNKLFLTVKSTQTNEKATCDVLGFWYNLNISVGDIVHICAVKQEKSSSWIVDNEHGLIVYKPDMLISSTSLVGSLYCKRKGVLKEKFHGFEPANKYLLIGSFVHELLQTVLKNGYCSKQEVEEVFNKMITSKNTIQMLYESSTKAVEIIEEINIYIPQIIAFVEKYVHRDNNKNLEYNKDDWRGKIDTIEDIEEFVWCPELGLKGKVDVSLSSSKRIMPLEIKTGKTSMSLEHRGQVILYILMMKKLGYNVSSGLLLYLREGVLREINTNHKEKRDLVMLRNELTYFLTRKPVINDSENKSKDGIKQAELPEPINNKNACLKCPYNTICCSYMKYENYVSNTFTELQDEVLNHLQSNHVEYFVHWNLLLDLEASEETNRNLSRIFMVSPKQREYEGNCLSNMKVTKVNHDCNVFYVTFEKIDESEAINIIKCGITENTYTTVSTDKRPVITAGFVQRVDSKSLTIALEKDILKKHTDNIFHLDTYISNYLESFNKTSLAILLEQTERAAKLRSFIIDRKEPVFKNELPKAIKTEGVALLKELNKPQQLAVLKAITAEDYILIKGMPGTGKTTLIVILIELLVKLGQTVLITSHTNLAVDNVCLRLKERGLDILRLGSKSKVHPKLYTFSEHCLTKDCTTVEELEKVYCSAKVLAATCFGTGHTALSKCNVDVCIVDESTQVLQSTLIRPLSVANKFILIGDPEQLPPIVKNLDAIKRGLTESLFDRLQSTGAVFALSLNYRMNKTITALANAVTYNGELKIGNETVENACLKIPSPKNFMQINIDHPWIISALNLNLSHAVQILDTGPVYKEAINIPWFLNCDTNKYGDDCFRLENPFEIAIVVTLVKMLLKCGVPPERIGVIAPFVAQVARFSSFLSPLHVDVNTVDQFQGQDKDVIFYSCTRSIPDKNKEYTYEILEDKRRLTVAITRAKHKLVIIGDMDTIKNYTPFQRLIENVKDTFITKVQDGKSGFSWARVLSNETFDDL